MINTVERLIALDNPAYWKIVSKLDGRFKVAHEKLLLEIMIRLSSHQSKPLESSALVHREDEDDEVRGFEGIGELFRWSCRSGPNSVGD